MGTGTLERGTGTREANELHRDAGSSRGDHDDRRRFTIAALIGLGIAIVPYLWVLWDHQLHPLRTAWPDGNLSNFYDMQARALFDGHWHLPKDRLGIEAFVIDGRDYMYQGPLPAVLRMPAFLVTDSLDGQLTAISMLLAWLVTGLFSSLLLWRVRILLRGPAALSRGEAVSAGMFIATVMGGSVLLYLATMPWVFHEAFAWAAALSIASLFALLGVLEQPSVGRVAATGALTLGAVLSRNTVGWGCVLAAVLAAIWFASGRGGDDNRRWWLPVLAAGLVPLAVGCAVNLAKFGTPFGIPMAAQVFTEVNAHRRKVLAENGGSLWSVRFLPSTVWAYLRPNGLRLTSVFPFVTLPATPARGVGGVVLDQAYRTGSAPASMPLLFLLGIWGTITAFRPRPVGRSGLTRIALIGAAAGTGGVFVWGYIAHRYLGDLLPLLVLAGAIGLVDLWRRVEGRKPAARGALAAVAALGLFGVTANLAVASAPTDRVAWEGDRVRRYVELQESLGDFTGRRPDVEQGDLLPEWAPADQLFVVGDCLGLYISTGEDDRPWIPVELKETSVDISVRERVPTGDQISLMTIGDGPVSTLSVEGDGSGRIRFRVNGTHNFQEFDTGTARPPLPSRWVRVRPDRTYRVTVVANSAYRPPRRDLIVTLDGRDVLVWSTWSFGEDVVTPRPPEPERLPLAIVRTRAPKPPLCRSLT